MKKDNTTKNNVVKVINTEKYCTPINDTSYKTSTSDPRESSRVKVRNAIEQDKEIVLVIEQDGIKGLPMAEHEVKRAARQGRKVRLIYGTRLSVLNGEASGDKRDESCAILIPANQQGYQNLCEIITLAYTEYYADKPAVPYEEVASRGDGLICIDDYDPEVFELSDEGLDLLSKEITEKASFSHARLLPYIKGSSEALKNRCYGRAHELYGDTLPPRIESRLSAELDAIVSNGYASIFSIAQMMTDRARSDGYPVGFRGMIGSSLAAYFAEITEVNPLPPHYICPECGHYEETTVENKAETCWELPKKCCPECGNEMRRDGYNIPLETLFGYRMDREPDIDLNFAPDYRDNMFQLLIDYFGEGRIVTAGICRSDGKTGFHPGGVFIVPEQCYITDFTPVQRQTLYPDDDKLVTHLDYHDVDSSLLKVDMLEHNGLRMLKELEDETGVQAEDIPLDDKATLEYLTNTEDNNSEYDMHEYNSLVEFGSDFARRVIKSTGARSFADLVRVDGLIHGTDTWNNNADLLISEGTASLREVISTRDDIMNYMLELGIDRENAYIIMDTVRKGKNLKEEQWQLMKDHGVPNWFLFSCFSVKYMFPRAHTVVYTMMAVRLAWYKAHYPDIYAKALTH